MKPTIFIASLLSWAVLAVAQPKQFPIETIEVRGSSYAQAFVLTLAGLQAGQLADESIFSEAGKKLESTGLFKHIDYQFGPGPAKTGYALVLNVADETALIDAEIDIPGVDETAVWERLHAEIPFQGKRLPSNDLALAFFLKLIEDRVQSGGVKRELTTRMGGTLGSTSSMTVYFQPKVLPKIAGLRFEGVREIGKTRIEQALSRVALSSEFTPHTFRLMLEQNIRPMYEESGMLSVRFGSVQPEPSSGGGVVVTTVVDEGRRYQLGRVELDTDSQSPTKEQLLKAGRFKTGQVANWRDISNSIVEVEKPLRRTGHLAIRTSPERILHDAEGTVDLTIHLREGPQFLFGKLVFSGLDARAEARARSLWRLESGQPMNQEYPDDFLRELRESREFARASGVSMQLKKGSGERVVDVMIGFR